MRVSGALMAVIAALFITTGTCHAKRMATRTEKATVADTVKSIEKQLKDHPKDEVLLYRLAQVHAAAYASKAKTINRVPLIVLLLEFQASLFGVPALDATAPSVVYSEAASGDERRGSALRAVLRGPD